MRYSNLVLQALLVLLGKRPPTVLLLALTCQLNMLISSLQNRRLFVLATTSNEHFLRDVDLLSSFSTVITVPKLTTANHIAAVLENTGEFNSEEIDQIRRTLDRSAFESVYFEIGFGDGQLLISYIHLGLQLESSGCWSWSTSPNKVKGTTGSISCWRHFRELLSGSIEWLKVLTRNKANTSIPSDYCDINFLRYFTLLSHRSHLAILIYRMRKVYWEHRCAALFLRTHDIDNFETCL